MVQVRVLKFSDYEPNKNGAKKRTCLQAIKKKTIENNKKYTILSLSVLVSWNLFSQNNYC